MHKKIILKTVIEPARSMDWVDIEDSEQHETEVHSNRITKEPFS